MKSIKTISCVLAAALLTACATEQEQKQEQPKKFTIHTIGDSTMAKKKPNKKPETGWGECIANLLNTTDVAVANYAQNGRSSKSFIGQGLWKTALDSIKPGDYLFIQFGHNDQKDGDSTRYTNATTTYKVNLRRYVNEARAKGATPVLFTSFVRRNFNENGVLIDTHGLYPEAVRQVAAELNVTLVDAQLISEQIVLAYGPEESKKLYNHVAAGHENYPDGNVDDTHLNEFGAALFAQHLINDLKAKDPRLAAVFK